MLDPQEHASIELSVSYLPVNKRLLSLTQIAITITLFCALLIFSPGVQAQDCKDVSTAQPNGHFTLTFLSISSAGGGKVTYSYKFRWDGSAPGLSHIVIGMCNDITQANLDSFTVTSTPASGPWGCSADAPQGTPCIQSDTPTGGFYGIKFSP